MSGSVSRLTPDGRTMRRRPQKTRGGFVQLPKYMITSPAWRSLSGLAVIAFVELSRRFCGNNNGALHLSARELAELHGCSKTSASEAIRELVEKGFVEILRSSGFNVKDKKRQASEYRLTLFPCDVKRQPASKAFMKWRPETHQIRAAE
jgi:Bacterial regulatory proteins, gntR family